MTSFTTGGFMTITEVRLKIREKEEELEDLKAILAGLQKKCSHTNVDVGSFYDICEDCGAVC